MGWGGVGCGALLSTEWMGAAYSPRMAPPGYCHLLVVFVGRQGGVYFVYFPIVPKLDFFFFFQRTIGLQVPTRCKHPVWVSKSANNFRKWFTFFSNKNPPVVKPEINDYKEHFVKLAQRQIFMGAEWKNQLLAYSQRLFLSLCYLMIIAFLNSLRS